MSEKDTFIQTRFYKNIRFGAARILSLLLIVAACGFIIVKSNDTKTHILILLVLFSIPILASVKSTWFTLNPLDKRVFTVSQDYLRIDQLTIPLAEVSSLVLYVHSYDGLRLFKNTLQGRLIPEVSEYGTKNQIRFIYKNQVYEMTFILAHLRAYLYAIDCGGHWVEHYNARLQIEDFDGLLKDYRDLIYK